MGLGFRVQVFYAWQQMNQEPPGVRDDREVPSRKKHGKNYITQRLQIYYHYGILSLRPY